MKIVFPNILMLMFRVALLASFIYMLQWPLEKFDSGQYLSHPASFWLGLLFFCLFPLLILWTLLGVVVVSIERNNKHIRFFYFYKTIKISAADIDGYYKTVKRTKGGNYNGLLIKLKTNKKVECSELDLNSIQPVK